MRFFNQRTKLVCLFFSLGFRVGVLGQGFSVYVYVGGRSRELVKPGTRKWKWETGDEKIGIFLHNCIACPLCIQQHLLEWTSATGDSGEEVEIIAYTSV